MDTVLYFFRDTITGIHYFLYAFILLFLMFAIIGYLFKQKYAKFDIKLNTSQMQDETVLKKETIENPKDKNIQNQTIPASSTVIANNNVSNNVLEIPPKVEEIKDKNNPIPEIK